MRAALCKVKIDWYSMADAFLCFYSLESECVKCMKDIYIRNFFPLEVHGKGVEMARMMPIFFAPILEGEGFLLHLEEGKQLSSSTSSFDLLSSYGDITDDNVDLFCFRVNW